MSKIKSYYWEELTEDEEEDDAGHTGRNSTSLR